jgi:tRNA-modifying protein YgfZ
VTQAIDAMGSERAALPHRNIAVELSHLSLVRVRGADALAFLNAQLTNDVRLVGANRAQLAAWCSPKGRALAVMLVLRVGDDYLLQLPAALQDAVLKRLRIYVLRSKVTLAVADDAYVRVGIAGPAAASLMSVATGTLPESDYAVAAAGGDTYVVRLPGVTPRYQLLAPADAIDGLRTTWADTAVSADAAAWRWHDIAAGVPEIAPETVEMFVPQMLNLDLIQGVNFEKGCYPGQEIVARVHYRGRIKERMFRAHADTATPPPPGAPLYAPDMGTQAAGNVVSAAPAPAGGFDLLVVAHISSVQAGQLRLEKDGEIDGPTLTIEPLPYEVPL